MRATLPRRPWSQFWCRIPGCTKIACQSRILVQRHGAKRSPLRTTPTVVFTTIDPVDSGRHRWSTRQGSAMSHSCQLPSPICLPPAMGSMFLADAVRPQTEVYSKLSNDSRGLFLANSSSGWSRSSFCLIGLGTKLKSRAATKACRPVPARLDPARALHHDLRR